MKKLFTTLCLTIAVVLGSAGMSWSADFQKGFTAAQSGDFATALREWTPLAEQGSATAQFNLGKLHQRGLGIPKDAKRAMYWFGLAASQGEASAMYEIGLIFDKGKGIEKNPIKAKE
ncbi:MAG: tetratricopeptide repeat protein, partial [Rhodospirillales bacterium]